jgi:N-acetylmuramoyl-L-alanine amidase
MGDGTWHIVEQGESVESIAAADLRSPDKIWAAPENDDLRQKRESMHVLLPGDRLFIPAPAAPSFKVALGSWHEFKIKLPETRLQLQLNHHGEAVANQPYELVVDGKSQKGQTGGDGSIDVPIPVQASSAVLTVGEGDDALVYELKLRELDPLATSSGVLGRLANLGFCVAADGGDGGDDAPDASDSGGELGLDAQAQAALCAFQQAHDIDLTGDLSDATKSKLKGTHGC